jgi:uncharacterized membrane protein (UPF0127 family)
LVLQLGCYIGLANFWCKALLMRAGWLLCQGQVLASLEVAESMAERSRGLLGRSGFDGALLLERTRSVHSAFMRFPIDVAFLNAERVVVATVCLGTWRVALPRRGGRSVIEAERGSFERWGLHVGDRLEIRDAT